MGLTHVIDPNMRYKMKVNEDGSINVQGLGDINIDVDGIKQALEKAFSNLEMGDVTVATDKMVAVRSYNGIETTDYKLNEPCHHITLANDSEEEEIALLINGLSITVKPWEVLEEEFKPFTEFTVEDKKNVDYRVIVGQRMTVEKEGEGE